MTATIEYYIGDKNLKSDFDIYVKSSGGLLDLPKRKSNIGKNWSNEHGTINDLSSYKVENREITLDCFIVADNNVDLVNKLHRFESLLKTPDTKRLIVKVDDKVLIYEVFLQDSIKIEKQWRQTNVEIVAAFEIKLIEPNPLKIVYSIPIIATKQIKLKISSIDNNEFEVFWGDNEKSYVLNDTETIHNYTVSKSVYMMICGNVENITSINLTNAAGNSIIWSDNDSIK